MRYIVNYQDTSGIEHEETVEANSEVDALTKLKHQCSKVITSRVDEDHERRKSNDDIDRNQRFTLFGF